jgi:hypothetical protein
MLEIVGVLCPRPGSSLCPLRLGIVVVESVSFWVDQLDIVIQLCERKLAKESWRMEEGKPLTPSLQRRLHRDHGARNVTSGVRGCRRIRQSVIKLVR